MKAYAARALVLTVLLLFGITIIRGGLWLLGGSKKTKETFQDARIVEPAKRDPDCKVIVLDAGHGGRDQGTSAGNVLEKDINLSMVKKLAELLDDDKIDILLTRETDTKIGLDARAEFANNNKADLFISLHCNYCEDDAGVQGLECYYREDSEEGGALAAHIVDAFQGEERVINRGTRTANFRVLCNTHMPAVLVEMGYLSNRTERDKLADEAYQDILAEKLAEGILASGLFQEEQPESDF